MERTKPATGGNTGQGQKFDLQDIICLLLRWWWVIAACAIFFPAAAYFYTNQTYVPQYTASATMLVNSKQVDVVNGQVVVVNDVDLSQQLVETYSVILKSDRVMELVMQDLGLNLLSSDLRKKVSLAPAGEDTEVISVSVRYTDPVLAANICNSIMKVAPGVISSTVEVGSVNVVDYAKVPALPDPPPAARNILLGSLLGLVLGAGLILTIRLFDHTIKNNDDVSARLGLTLMGSVPHIKHRHKKGQNAIISDADNPSWMGFGFVEAFKGLRTNLQFASAVNNAKKLLVTSTLHEEGKSTTSINLAVTLAQSGKSVLVIDCDLRKPGIHKLLGLALEEGRGLAAVLAGDLDARAGVVFMEGSGIHVLPGGLPVPNPSELLESENMANLLALLESDYDYVLMDTPPAYLFTDAAALSKHADGVILVVKQSYAGVNTVCSIIDDFENIGVRMMGCVLNGVKSQEAGARYKYHYNDRYLSHYYKEYGLQPGAVSLRRRIVRKTHLLLRKAACGWVFVPLTFTGLLLMGVALWGYFMPMYHSSKLIVSPPVSVASINNGHEETRLVAYPRFGEQYATLLLPSLGVSRPVFFGDSRDQLMAGVGHFSGSNFPGEGGTIVYAGHNDLVFNKLKDIKVGEDVLIQTNYGSFRYRVFDAQIINGSNEVHIEPRGGKSVLVMYTCHPQNIIGFKPDRYVVFAEQVQDAPPPAMS